MKFLYITAVWGEDFTKTWLETCLPLQVGQLVRKGGDGDRFVAYTDDQSNPFSQSLPWLPISSQVHRHSVPSHLAGYQKMNWLNLQAIKEYAAQDTCLVFLSPDVLYADGAFEFARQRILAGKRAVLVPMFRTMKHAMVESMRGRTTISNRQLLDVAFQNTHGLTDCLFWDAPIFYGYWPSHIYWRIPGGGIRGNCWHQHPFAVVMPEAVSPDGTLDADLLLKTGMQREDMVIVTDSDQFCAVEMTARESHIPMPGGPRSVEAMVEWAHRNATPLDKHFFANSMRWHTEPVVYPCAEEDAANQVCVQILRGLDEITE